MHTRKLATATLLLAHLPTPIIAAKARSVSIQVTEVDIKNGTANAVAHALIQSGVNVVSVCRVYNSGDAPVLGCWPPSEKEDNAQTSKSEANLEASIKEFDKWENAATKYDQKAFTYTMDGLSDAAKEALTKSKDASDHAKKAYDDDVDSIGHISIVRGLPPEQIQLAQADLIIRHEQEFSVKDLLRVGSNPSSQDTTCESYGSDIYCNSPGGATLEVTCAGSNCTSRYSPGTPQTGNGKPLSAKQMTALEKIRVWRLHVRSHRYKVVAKYEIMGNNPADVVAMVREYESHHRH